MRLLERGPLAIAALIALLGGPSAVLAQPMGGGFDGSPASPARSGSGLSLDPNAPAAPALQFLPGVRASQSYSTNALRLRPGQERDGFTTEISPYLRTDVNSARLRANVDFALRNFYRTETAAGVDSVDTLRYTLNAQAHYLAPGDQFGVTGSGFVRDINTSPFSVIGEDASLTPQNRQRFSMFSLAPYLTGRMGTIANYRAEYMLRSSQVSGGGNLVDHTDQRLTGSLVSPAGSGPWTWSASGSRQHRDFGSGFTMGRSELANVLRLQVMPELRTGLSLNYSQIDRLTGSNGKDHGWGPGAEIAWFPSPRTSLSASWSSMYYGPTSRLDFSHRRERWTLGMRYTRTMMSSSDASVLTFNPASLFAGGEQMPLYQAMLDQQLVDRGNSVLGTGLVTDAVVQMEQAYATVGYSAAAFSLFADLFRNTRERRVANQAADVTLGAFTGQISQRGINLRLSVPLGPRSSVRLHARNLTSDSSTDNLHTQLKSLQLSYDSRLSEKTTTAVGVRRTLQKSNGGGAEYQDSTVFGTLDVKF